MSSLETLCYQLKKAFLQSQLPRIAWAATRIFGRALKEAGRQAVASEYQLHYVCRWIYCLDPFALMKKMLVISRKVLLKQELPQEAEVLVPSCPAQCN
jgi:hypothetical protein